MVARIGRVVLAVAALGAGCSASKANPPAAGDGGSTDDGESTGASETTGRSTTEVVGESSSESTSTGAIEDDATRLELRIDGFTVLPIETYYGCFDFTFQLDELGQIVRLRPALDRAEFVHHFVLTMTDAPSGQAPGSPCFDLDGDIIWAWAPGQVEFVYPPEAGYLIGDRPGGVINLRLQVHYNNPGAVAGQVDRSGFDMWVTRNLREYDAGTLVFGAIEQIEIPPGVPEFEYVGRCTADETRRRFEHPLQVFGTSMHAHTLGRALWTEVFRDGQSRGELNRDDPYDFDLQTFKQVNFVLEPGDELVNHCVYDSSGVTEITYGGPGTRDEMCWDTIVYYPKLSNGFDYCTLE